MRRERLVMAALFLGACAHPNAGANRSAIGAANLTDICDVFANPANYSGSNITVRGIVRTDYFEFSGITDMDCPRRTIAFGPERGVQHGLTEFSGALERVRGDRVHVVEVTAYGTLSWRPDQVPTLVLGVTDLSDAAVVERPSSMPPIDPR